jgi:hypothetical protein
LLKQFQHSFAPKIGLPTIRMGITDCGLWVACIILFFLLGLLMSLNFSSHYKTHQNLEKKLVQHMKKIVQVGEKEPDLNYKKLLNSFELK